MKEIKTFFTEELEKVKSEQELRKLLLERYNLKDILILETNDTFFVTQKSKLKKEEIKKEKKNIFSENEIIKLPESLKEINKIKVNDSFIKKVIENLDDYFDLFVKK